MSELFGNYYVEMERAFLTFKTISKRIYNHNKKYQELANAFSLVSFGSEFVTYFK